MGSPHRRDDEELIGRAIWECLKNGDSEGVIEVIRIYLEAVNKTQIAKENDMARSTMYHTLKSKNPTVKIAGVIGIPPPSEGHVPKAFVELKQGYKATEEELKAFVRKHLRDVKVPAEIVFVDHLPVSHTGKIAREELKQL